MRHHTIESDRPVTIRRGDITGCWGATTSFRTPTCKGKGYRTKSRPVTDLDALRKSVLNAERPVVTSSPVHY